MVKDHRLFVCDARGLELGYLSFKDDRPLFGLIPLFERREAQVRMKIRKCEKKAKSADVDLWISGSVLLKEIIRLSRALI